jgi:hypothetical protein
MRNLLRGSVLALALTLMACDGNSPTASSVDAASLRAKNSGGSGSGGGGGGGGGGVPSSGGGSGSTSINYLTAAPGAPAISPTVVSFYAVQGSDRTVEIFYAPTGNGAPQRFLRFQVRGNTQIVRPNGSNVARGDSIQITLTVIDPSRLITQFEPSGLTFKGGGQARLAMSFAEENHDFNGDGVINALDTAIQASLSIFRQESATAPWIRVGSAPTGALDELEAVIGGFTNYVIAY